MSSNSGIQVDPQQMLDDGYIVVRNVIPPGRLAELRASFEVLVERQKAIWEDERRRDNLPGSVWETAPQPRLFFNNNVDEATADTVAFCLHENTLGVSSQLMRGPEVGLHALMLMCSPVRDHGPARWHRDTGPDTDAPLQGLHYDMMENGPGYVQWNIPLYDDDVLWVVPGSHRRANTEAENLQLEKDDRAPLPGGIPVKLRAGDGVVYTNFILHWGSNYSSKLRRTIHLGYQSFGGPLYRYFHLWWDLDFTRNLPQAVREPFERWARAIDRDHDMIEAIYRAMLDRDAKGFRAGLDALHPGEKGRMVCAAILCKEAQTLHAFTRPEFEAKTADEQAQLVNPNFRHLYEDLARRFTPAEFERLWLRFGVLDAKLQDDAEQMVAGTQAKPTKYRVYEMPENFDVEEFIASWS
ncbi:MAG: hypothetical protein OXL39_03915 [Caldilineaceae bacterium]|nr:hypothetical protein [Caldilineaceae bacterium]